MLLCFITHVVCIVSTNVSLLVCFVNLVESVLILYEKYYTVTLCNLTVTLYLHKVTVRFHKVIVRFHKVTVSTNYEIELKNQYLMLDNFIICYSIKIFITLQSLYQSNRMSVSESVFVFVCSLTPTKRRILMSWNFEGSFPLGWRRF